MRSKFFAILCLMLTLALSTLAAEPDIRLAGIVNLPGYQRAVLEESKSHRCHVLATGERDGEIEVKTISPSDLTATISWFHQDDLKLAMDVKTDQFNSSTPT